jgi:peroxiredoxin family protein/TusA-related sulfurtransferase
VIEVLADDPAFDLDLKSWCRSTSAKLLSIEPDGKVLRARVQTAGADAGARTVRELPTIEVPPGNLASPHVSTPAAAAPATVSLAGVATADRIPRLQAILGALAGGSSVTVVADDPSFGVELVQWAAGQGHRLLAFDARDELRAELLLAAPPPSTALVPVDDANLAVRQEPEVPQCTLLVLHNDREALLAALLVAVGAASQGMNVMMFFTFWGLNLLRGENLAMPEEPVSWAQRMFKWMMPKGPAKQKLGKLDMGGMGRSMLGSIMKQYRLMDIPELMVTAEEQGVQFVACTMSMQVMGITKRDLAPRGNLDFGGVAAFVESASRSRVSLTF